MKIEFGVINLDAFNKMKGRMGREHLIANGFPESEVDKLSDIEAWEISLEHINQFLGI